MTLRHRWWWVAGALLCVSAAVTQRARADEAWPTGAPGLAVPQSPARGPGTPGSSAAQSAAADALVRAEGLYREGRLDAARDDNPGPAGAAGDTA